MATRLRNLMSGLFNHEVVIMEVFLFGVPFSFIPFLFLRFDWRGD